MGRSQAWFNKKRRLYRLKSRDFADARRRALKARDRGDSPKSRSWASEAREHIRRGPEYPILARRGRQSQDRGRRAQSRDVKWFAERVGWENVRDRSKQEAAAIRLGADYDVFGSYPLVVQRKHSDHDTPKSAWKQIISAPAGSDQVRLVHLELPRGKNGRHIDLAVMAIDDAKQLFHVAHLGWGQIVTVEVKERFNVRDRWAEVVGRAAKMGRGIAVIEAVYVFGVVLWIFEWKVFQKAWEQAACR